MNNILNKIQKFVYDLLSEDSSGHDYHHIQRVVTHAENILKEEKADRMKVLLAAWLHDVGDYKLHGGIDKTREIVFPLLSSLNFEEEYINEIIQIISEVSFNGGHNTPPSSIEAKIVQDADRLDAIGAIGIARTFAYGGSKGREIYNPEEKPENYSDVESYKKNTSCTLMHFYEKLLKLKDLMNTETGKKLAEKRHNFMLKFLEEFYEEVR